MPEVKKFTVICDFSGQHHPLDVYIGEPKLENHPLQFQADWVSSNKGGMISSDVMSAISDINNISQQNEISLCELCTYALESHHEDDIETETPQTKLDESQTLQYK